MKIVKIMFFFSAISLLTMCAFLTIQLAKARFEHTYLLEKNIQIKFGLYHSNNTHKILK